MSKGGQGKRAKSGNVPTGNAKWDIALVSTPLEDVSDQNVPLLLYFGFQLPSLL
jgi:hypothetical protein